MKALVVETVGRIEDLALAERPSPTPRRGQVKIAVHAAGVNFADALIVQGKYQVRPEPPYSPGIEVSGEVMEAGEGVDGLHAGDRVVAILPYGGFAEEVVAPAHAVMPIPDGLAYAQAAAFPVAYGTAHVALDHRGRLQPGETLLVHGAAGGVGLAAVEVGKAMGATVIATAGTPEKLGIARAHGADRTLDYTQGPFRDAVKELGGADVVFDPVGGDVFDQSLRCINWEGRILVIGFAAGTIPQAPTNILLVKNVGVIGTFWGAYVDKDPETVRASLETLFAWQQEGKLQPHVSAVYPLAEAGDALQALLDRKATGKLVIAVREG